MFLLTECIAFFATILVLVHSKSVALEDNSAILISKYAKVAHWGAVSTSTEKVGSSEGRSNSGQTLWTHRSDARVRAAQNLKTPRPSVVYHYPVKTTQKKPMQKLSQGHREALPGVGEVQDRFNPRPYFDYQHVPSKYGLPNSRPAPVQAPAPAPAGPTFDSFPVFSQPPGDPYASSVSSYNPPSAGPSLLPNDNGGIPYPPNGPPPPDAPPASPTQDSAPESPPSDPSDGSYSYTPPPMEDVEPEGPPKPALPSSRPPLAPKKPQKAEQLYYPPSDDGNDQETILDHPPPGYEEKPGDHVAPDMGRAHDDMGGPPDDMGGPPGGMRSPQGPPPMPQGGPPQQDHDMAEGDLNPPPPGADMGAPGGGFPPYLYSHPHGQDFGQFDLDHHVYKEITTTTEAPRVNKGHYSYYYLGRKLWYIPLYFSVYFIIYVFVLILKSIARHKIQFKHHIVDDHRKARTMTFEEQLNDIHRNVTTAIENTKKRFPYIAM